ncbi:hypothetical protein [Nocardia tengchongensis]
MTRRYAALSVLPLLLATGQGAAFAAPRAPGASARCGTPSAPPESH